jgi:hypothetical protein
MTSSGIFMYMLLAVVAVSMGVVGYFRWRDRVFISRSLVPRTSRSRPGETTEYLTAMVEALSSETARAKSWGSDQFDQAPYLELLSRLDELQPPAESSYYDQHAAYREAVAVFARRRVETMEALSAAAPLVRNVSGDERVDCRSAANARDLVLTYAPSVDPLLQAAPERCEEERKAYEGMQDALSKWRQAIYTRTPIRFP